MTGEGVRIRDHDGRMHATIDLSIGRDREGLALVAEALHTLEGVAKATEAGHDAAAALLPRPFEEDGVVASIGALTIENRADLVSFRGSCRIGQDPGGEHDAGVLLAVLKRTAAALEIIPDLPERTRPDTAAVQPAPAPFG